VQPKCRNHSPQPKFEWRPATLSIPPQRRFEKAGISGISLVIDAPSSHEIAPSLHIRPINVQRIERLARGAPNPDLSEGTFSVPEFLRRPALARDQRYSHSISATSTRLPVLGRTRHHAAGRIEVSRQQAWLKQMRGTVGNCSRGPKGGP
jgi:hypothetical protein